MMRRMFFLLLVTASLSALVGACTVNDLPSYRTRISDVQLTARVDRLGEVIFVSPQVVNPDSPESVALGVMESEIRQRLAARLAEVAGPEAIAQRFRAALGSEFDAALPWQRVQGSEAPDALFTVTLERYGVSVDAGGVGVLFFDSRVEGRFLETGEVIYEETVRSAVSLAEAWEGYDALSEAAARAQNLMALDQLSEADFESLVHAGAEQAAARLVGELLHDAWE